MGSKNELSTDSMNSVANNNQYETICKPSKLVNHHQHKQHANNNRHDDVIRPTVDHTNHITNNNEHNNQYGKNNQIKNTITNAGVVSPWQNSTNKKPPILPKRSTIINLDKNRIRVKRRSRILGRPISLPNNLMKLQQKTRECESKPADVSLDIAVIKKLEDDIYKRKEDVTRNCENTNCTNCSKPIDFRNSFQPNSVLDGKVFQIDANNMNRQNVRPLLMLDTWQLEPLLLKYKKDINFANTTTMEDNSVSVQHPKSILIVDNSKFYPILMKYEINADQRQQVAEDSPTSTLDRKQQSSTSCVCIETSSQSKNLAKLFESCIGGGRPGSMVMRKEKNHANSREHDEQIIDKPLVNNKREILVKPIISKPMTSSSTSAHNIIESDNHKNMKAMAASSSSPKNVSKFKRFIMHRRSLNLSSTQRHTSTDEVDVTTNHTGSNNDVDVVSSAINMDNIIPQGTGSKHLHLVHHDVYMHANNSKTIGRESTAVVAPVKFKNTKLNWLLANSIKTSNESLSASSLASSVSFLLAAAKCRKWKSLGDLSTMLRDSCDENYFQIYCDAFKGISWSEMDLLTIKRKWLDKMISVSAIDADKMLPNSCSSTISSSNGSKKSSTPTLVQRVKKRRSLIRQEKRYSLGSADIVKAWVYRKRYILYNL